MSDILTFEKIMDCYADNRIIYDEIKKNIENIIPFIGAGLSASIFPTWVDALKEITSNITDIKKREYINSLINHYKLEEAAQKLENLRSPNILKQDIINIFSTEKINKNLDLIKEQSVYLLPLLFSKSIITTNYDQILETVYQEHGMPFDYFIFPSSENLFNQTIAQNQKHFLFKIHGGIINDIAENDTLIFTKKQYKHWYKPTSPLTRELKKCYSNQNMLFLGCSLNIDRTLKYLKATNNSHYAMLELPSQDIDKKITFLNQHNIKAIFYPAKKHESIHIILERLLEEINPNIFKNFNMPQKNSLPLNSFEYCATLVSFVGRDKELQLLTDFCEPDSSSLIKWWALTGPGGSGKSRLAQEFANSMKRNGWNVTFLFHNNYNHLKSLSNELTKKTIIIADYAQTYIRELGQWIDNLIMEPRSLPIRILLIEREGNKLNSTSWIDLMLSTCKNKRIIEDYCYSQSFLHLEPLNQSSLEQIINDFSQLRGYTINYEISTSLYQALKKFDPQYCRPLLAFYIVDAYLHEENSENWFQIKDVLDYAVQQELNYYHQKILSVCGDSLPNERLNLILDQIKIIATMWGNVTLNELKKYYPLLYKKICQMVNNIKTVLSLEDFLLKISFITNNCNTISGIEPGLVGEYFIYEQLIHHFKEHVSILEPLWNNPIRVYSFYLRFINNYYYLLNPYPEIWKGILSCKYNNFQKLKYTYGLLLVDVIDKCNDYIICNLATNKIKMLLYPISTNDRVQFYTILEGTARKRNKDGTQGDKVAITDGYIELFNNQTCTLINKIAFLCDKNDKHKRTIGFELLKELSVSYPSMFMLSKLANAGVNCITHITDKKEAYDVIKYYNSLRKKNSFSNEIANCVANMLVIYNDNFTLDNNEKNYIKNLFSVLLKEYSNTEIATSYSLFLQSYSNTHNTTMQIEKVLKQYPSENVANSLALFLCKILYESNKDYSKIINKIKDLYTLYPSNITACAYALSLHKKQITKKGKDISALITQYKILYENYPCENIAKLYSYSLYNMLCHLPIDEKEIFFKHIEKLFECYPYATYFTYIYGLLQITFLKKIHDDMLIVPFKKLYLTYKSSDTAIPFSSILSNVPLEYDPEEPCKIKVEFINNDIELHESVRIHIQNESITQLSYSYDKAIIYMKTLKNLYMCYPSSTLASIISIGLFHFDKYLSIDDKIKNIEFIEDVVIKYPENEIIRNYILGLIKMLPDNNMKILDHILIRLNKILSSKFNVDRVIFTMQELNKINLQLDKNQLSKTFVYMQKLYTMYPQKTSLEMYNTICILSQKNCFSIIFSNSTFIYDFYKKNNISVSFSDIIKNSKEKFYEFSKTFFNI